MRCYILEYVQNNGRDPLAWFLKYHIGEISSFIHPTLMKNLLSADQQDVIVNSKSAEAVQRRFEMLMK